MQDTFARVLSKPRVLRGDDDLAYLMRVLRNTFFSARRTASRRPVTAASLEDVVATDSQPMGQPERALDVHELYGAIAGLPEDFRLALVAVDIVGLSYRDAAKVLRTREATITTRLFRARRQVVRSLQGEASEMAVAHRRPAGAGGRGAEIGAPAGRETEGCSPPSDRQRAARAPAEDGKSPRREGLTASERLAEQGQL